MFRLALILAALSGVVFVGTLAWGQSYGAMLDAAEQQAMAETFQYALEYNRTNEASAWVNPDTERSGTVVPVHTYQNGSGLYCREFITTVIIGGSEEQAYGTACRQPDGTWMIVSDTVEQPAYQVVERVIERHYIYPYRYPYWYDHYPYFHYPRYHSARIFFSFNIVHFVGTRHVKVPHFHFHGAHQHKGLRDFRKGPQRPHRDGIVRSHRGGAPAGQFQGRRDLRSGPERSVVQPNRGGAAGREFQGQRNFRSEADERTFRQTPRGGPGRDFHRGRDFRSSQDERIVRPNRGGAAERGFRGERNFRSEAGERMHRPQRGPSPGRDSQGGREYRGRGGDETQQFRGAPRPSGDRSHRSGRR